MVTVLQYISAEDVREKANKIVQTLGMNHIDMRRVHFFRSKGSKSKRVQARIHGMGRIWSHALGIPPQYAIEVISERYDLSPEEVKEKIIIHELLHIPHRFSGGFVPHKRGVTRKRVEKLFGYLKAAMVSSKSEEVRKPMEALERFD